ncbi:MAG: ABC transporter permease [Gammaproteobacteria bacterium]|nr:ABC transporter permease [Gammaproteobacteria bacterium]
MSIFNLAIKSILNRKFTALLTIFSIALSVTLLLGVERLRIESRTSFANTISGTDLVVGARSGSIQLLLYSVFRIGNATNNISWKSYQDIIHNPKVKWSIPISLGDSHQGFRVMGTTKDYFQYFRYARKHHLSFEKGKAFHSTYDAVLGADVAEKLNYKLGQKIILAHGAGKINLMSHDNKPFHVIGILKKTGTPVDRTVHVKLQGIEAIHADWQNGAPIPGFKLSPNRAEQQAQEPKTITAFLLGLHSRISTFKVQRNINKYKQEPLLAILPGVALQELWDMMGIAEKALLAISAFVILVGLTGMVTVILTSLNERRREMAILRSVGARPLHIFSLIMGEAIYLTVSGVVVGLLLLYLLLAIAQPVIETQLGLFIPIDWPTNYELILLSLILLSGAIISIIPAYRAYRYSLADGMTIRI